MVTVTQRLFSWWAAPRAAINLSDDLLGMRGIKPLFNPSSDQIVTARLYSSHTNTVERTVPEMFLLALTVMSVLAWSSESAAVVEDSLLNGNTADSEGSFFGLRGM